MNSIVTSEKSPTVRAASGPNQLEQLKKFTRVVADTGDFALLKEYAPEDATTNPTLILKAAQKPEYHALLEKAVRGGGENGQSPDEIDVDVWSCLAWRF